MINCITNMKRYKKIENENEKEGEKEKRKSSIEKK